MSRLETILQEMRAQAGCGKDTLSLMMADYLLIRTIRALGGNAGEQALADEIVNAYFDVREWIR